MPTSGRLHPLLSLPDPALECMSEHQRFREKREEGEVSGVIEPSRSERNRTGERTVARGTHLLVGQACASYAIRTALFSFSRTVPPLDLRAKLFDPLVNVDDRIESTLGRLDYEHDFTRVTS